MSIFALDVETISFPFTSKSPPNCGVVSPTISEAESETSTVFDDVLNDQREIIYEKRKEILKADSVAGTIADFIENINIFSGGFIYFKCFFI